MSEYKNTLNLPQTDFPMKANLAHKEPEILKKWDEINIYQRLRQTGSAREKFILHLGPPYANGHIHLGTATTTVLKDMIVKAKTIAGFDSPLVPGWDCHGLPIEVNVEKKIGKPGQKVSAEEFRKACREYANSFVNIQREEFKRLGIIADWANPYLTMNPMYEANIIRSLAKIIAAGHVAKGSKPVHWCLDCASALAEAEVEYMEKTSPAIDVRFKVADIKDFISRFKKLNKEISAASVPIWTTTPWTLPANEAVALNPLLKYVLVEVAESGDHYLIAEDLLAPVMARYKIEHYQVIGEGLGEQFLNIKLHHPFYDKLVPIVCGDHVTIETGTGAVHTAPAHGQEDYLIGKQYHLSLHNPVGDDGCYLPGTPLFAGVFVRKADDLIIQELEKTNTLILIEKIKHSYPMCWRHKTPLIFRATAQWFVSMEQKGLRAAALKAVGEVEWIPAWGESRIYGMIEGRPDWCISRQRTWGVPLSLFIHKQTGDLHPNIIQLMEQVAKLVEKDGIEAWYQLDLNSILQDEQDREQYKKSLDVLDVWFDSGVSHECVLRVRPELRFPADIVLEGSDQHRGWFQSSLLTSMAMNNCASFREVLTHGFVVDGEGRKMSKSLGNVIAPQEVIQSMGADVLRLWVASVDYRYEITASKEILARASEAYRRIRNTVRFLLANMHDFDPSKDRVDDDDLLSLDRWAVDRALQLQQEIMEAYDKYQFHLVVQKLHQFCLTDLGGFYLDIIKDRQYTMAKESRGRRSAQTALYHIAHALVRWMAPIISFTAEEVWQYLPGTNNLESVFMTVWYDQLFALPNDEFMNRAFWEKIRSVREAVNKEIENQRNAGKIGSALEAEVYLYCGPNLLNTLTALEDELRFVLITSFVNVIPEHAGPVDTVVTDVPGLAIKIEATKALKCERCWQRRADVGKDAKFPGICGRCIENISGVGEKRLYA